MPKRQEEEEAEWMARKDDILDLYVVKDKPLSEVMRTMAGQGFAKTKPQYERSLKRWRVSKNVREEEWDFIFSRMNERQRPTVVKVRGITISQSRIQKKKGRKRETVFNHCVSQLHPLPRCQTPPDIEISTPPSVFQDAELQPIEDSKSMDDCGSEANRHRQVYKIRCITRCACDKIAQISAHSPEKGCTQDTPAASKSRNRMSPLSLRYFIMAPMIRFSAKNALETPSGKVTKWVSRMPGNLPSFLYLVSDKGLFPFSEPLRDYIRAFVSENPDGIFSKDFVPENQRYLYEDQNSSSELANYAGDYLDAAFVQYKTPDVMFRKIMEDTQEDYNLGFLRRLLRISRLNEDWKRFAEDLLLDAAENGNLPLIHILSDAGVNLMVHRHKWLKNEKAEYRGPFNALQIAVLNRHISIILMLDSRDVPIFTGNPHNDLDFLSHAITQSVLHLVSPLLAKANREETPAFSLAVRTSHYALIEIFLKAGFNPYRVTRKTTVRTGLDTTEHLADNCDSPFMSGLNTKSKTILRKFVDYSLERVDKELRLSQLRQLIAGYVFALGSEDLELQNAILETGLDTKEVEQMMGYDYVKQCLYYALEEAAACNDCEKVESLLQRGATPNAPFPDKAPSRSTMTPLLWAIKRENVPIVCRLLAAEADVNASSIVYGRCYTALQMAVVLNSLDMVSLLVEAGANVNVPPAACTKTAIEIAASLGNLELLTYLLEAGTDIQGPQNRAYRRALWRGQKRGYSCVAALLNGWKKSKYGEQDCDTIDNIMSSMQVEELDFASEEARISHVSEAVKESANSS